MQNNVHMSAEQVDVGMVGAGQLGLMSADACKRLGFTFLAIDKIKDGVMPPMGQSGVEIIDASINDQDAIAEAVRRSKVTTWEGEHFLADILVELEGEGHNIQPSPRWLQIVQNKNTQKLAFTNPDVGIPMAPFARVTNETEFEAFGAKYGDGIAKVCLGGFDGRGNIKLSGHSWSDVEDHFRDTDTHIVPEIIVEKEIAFKRELATIAARDTEGNIDMYPVVETVHSDQICNIVQAPADISPRKALEAQEMMRAVLSVVEGAGVFALELFDTDDSLLANEFIMRVHNSGHWTIDGAWTSQFEQHIRAVSGLPLGSMEMKVGTTVMVNLLGQGEMPLNKFPTVDDIRDALAIEPDARIYLYGKGARPDRKMGHYNLTGTPDERDEVRQRAERLREYFKF